jgi:sialidase-1
LVAVFEGRKHSVSDDGDIDTLVVRSLDGGSTWSAPRVIADHGPDAIGNPCTVIDRNTDTIWSVLRGRRGTLNQQDIIAGRGSNHIWITKSTDDGRNWTTPVDITQSLRGKDPNLTFYTLGPGRGIQLRNGRLVVSNYFRWQGSDVSYAVVMYSDDHGKTWKVGKPAGPETNEGQVVELGDGSLMYNMRSQAGKNRRAVSRSYDGGETWTTPMLDVTLIEPVCQASILQWRDRLYFSNPAATTRVNMTVRMSLDEGITWPFSHVIYIGPSAYSCLTPLPDGTVGCLYERGERSPYEKLTFAKIAVV